LVNVVKSMTEFYFTFIDVGRKDKITK